MRGVTTNRRGFFKLASGAAAATALGATAKAADGGFKLRYILGSCMYGKMNLAEILPEVSKIDAEHVDIWPEPHGNQREQIEACGFERFAAMLNEQGVSLGILTHYDLGPFGLLPEIPVAKQLGASMMICGGKGPKSLEGGALKSAVQIFAEQMKPHVEAAGAAGVVIGIENHANNLIESPDSMKWLAEFTPAEHIGIALAPYHLEQKPKPIARLIEDLGEHLVHFYAWQHGKGSHEPMAKEDELLQLPGRGELDFKPIVDALKKIKYAGWTEIFMHPYPRGVPIQPTAAEVTAEINRSRTYLESLL
ncbi:MAG TPA: sugar phosphate isomerase/epimerase [Candidatus Hydrogenedentes bacterium]|nr:sugar phosphate isomerase/epimerase [Candidatus Hydrogenedentota bacterium]